MVSFGHILGFSIAAVAISAATLILLGEQDSREAEATAEAEFRQDHAQSESDEEDEQAHSEESDEASDGWTMGGSKIKVVPLTKTQKNWDRWGQGGSLHDNEKYDPYQIRHRTSSFDDMDPGQDYFYTRHDRNHCSYYKIQTKKARKAAQQGQIRTKSHLPTHARVRQRRIYDNNKSGKDWHFE